jgi:hypothetical protein
VSDAANTTFNTPVNPATFWGGQFVTDIDFGKLLGGKRDIYVTLSSTSGTRIVRSTDNGVNFFDVTGNLPNLVNVRCILVDPTNDNDWYVGSDLGVWVSYDGGTNWIPFSNQLPAASYVMDLEFDPYSSKIVAGTYGRGVFISDRFVLSVDDERSLPSEFVLSNNYPNPFNPKTTIKYSVPNLSFVTIKVFDVLGKEVASLVNDEKSVGSYEVEFNAGNLSSGIYLYRLQAGSFVETKKMVLMK